MTIQLLYNDINYYSIICLTEFYQINLIMNLIMKIWGIEINNIKRYCVNEIHGI